MMNNKTYELLQDLNILQTNAVEGLEQTQNTIDSQKCIDNIRKYVTPPTSEDVCEALSEWVGRDVKYNQDLNEFYYEWRTNGEDGIAMIVGNSLGKVKFYRETFIPHLITLIGRFYEEVENNEKSIRSIKKTCIK